MIRRVDTPYLFHEDAVSLTVFSTDREFGYLDPSQHGELDG